MSGAQGCKSRAHLLCSGQLQMEQMELCGQSFLVHLQQGILCLIQTCLNGLRESAAVFG